MTTRTAEERWAAVYAHRERLLRIARARLGSAQDAEDCVQEAMLRCVEFAGLDEERMGQFLTTVTVRLCADVHRGHTRGDRLHRRLTSYVSADPGPEDTVCDRAESVWLSGRVDDLPDRQRAMVQARAEGLSCAAVAERFRVSYTAVESAIARARRSMRMALESTYGLVGRAIGWPPARYVTAPAVVAGAGALLVLHVVAAMPGGAGSPARAVAATARPPVTRAVPAAATHVSRATPPARTRTGLAGVALLRPALGLPPYRTKPLARVDGPGGVSARGETHEHDYTAVERIEQCVQYGVDVEPGPRFECRYPPKAAL